MSSSEILLQNEKTALVKNQVISRVVGKSANSGNGSSKSFGAGLFVVIMLVLFGVFFSSGNMIPSLIADRLIEETDVQYADAVESKKLVFQQALKEGNVPKDTAEILEDNGVSVGYVEEGKFVPANQHEGGLVLLMDDKIITAENFIGEISSNVRLYIAFTNATYSRAAYYYDDAAKEVFRELGTTRNNYGEDDTFDDVMTEMMKGGNNVEVNTVSKNKKTRINEETGEEETYYVYEENGGDAKLTDDAGQFISLVSGKNAASDTNESTLYAADSLKVADTVSKEQRSSLFYLIFMESISKMKAGEGNNSEVNAAMSYLHQSAETEVVDVKTGETKIVSGSPLESPSLYAILSGEQVNAEEVENYSSDRILKTVENKLGQKSGLSVIKSTVASTAKNLRSAIGKFIGAKNASPSLDTLEAVKPTVNKSLVDNSYDSIKGIDAGEFLVEGAVNVGKRLAKASGASAGDASAALAYQKLNTEVLAMDAKVDRINRSPFDITSKNTFLGSIVYNIAKVGRKQNTILGRMNTLVSTVAVSVKNLLPATFADDEKEGYLSTFGDCETYATINAVGSAHCSEIATFDTSTLDDPFNDEGFIEFVNQNTTLTDSGKRVINKGSALSNYIIYNNKRSAPLGTTDGGILESLKSGSSSINYVSDILKMIKGYINSDDDSKRIATGAAFVNSASNSDWQTYKYAQRYVSLARATEVMRQYSNDTTAYNQLRFFEGDTNPVVAFINEYFQH